MCVCVCVCWAVHSCHLIFWSFCTKDTALIILLIIYSNTKIANGWVDFSWSHTFLVTSLDSKMFANTLNFPDVSHVHTNLHHQLFVNVLINIWICIVNGWLGYSSGSPHTDEFTSPILCKRAYKYLNLYHGWQDYSSDSPHTIGFRHVSRLMKDADYFMCTYVCSILVVDKFA